MDDIFDDIPVPSHRHAMPSGPWPWMDIGTGESVDQGTRLSCNHENCEDCATWLNYPQSLFPNWTRSQVLRSGMLVKSGRQTQCQLFYLDIDGSGEFSQPREIPLVRDQEKELWDLLHTKRPENISVRAVFVENITSPVLRILGARYNIEPFFFSSSLNWIPSRYQEDVQKGKGDHITVTLTFLRSMQTTSAFTEQKRKKEMIDTQAPLVLCSGGNDRMLILDTLAIHLIRSNTSSTIISYHPNPKGRATTKEGLHARFTLIGSSVYWKNIFAQSKDPTFLMLAMLWHGMYAWDEALETLYNHISALERQVMKTRDMKITGELHEIRAHLLHYNSLLDDFRKSVEFILDARNPALEPGPETNKEHRILQREADNLLSEISRLQRSRESQDMRLRNVINLVFSLVNLDDSKRSQELTSASLRDSEATKQVSYLTMIFLPSIFISGVFSMNVREINPSAKIVSLADYGITSAIFTIITAWLMVALQAKQTFGDHIWTRFLWPYTLGRKFALQLWRSWRT